MRTAKKVLSIVLAVMLVLGTLTVAVSAINPGAGQYAKWTLKAEVMDSSFSTTLKGIGAEDAQKTITTANKNAQKAEITAYSNMDEHTYEAYDFEDEDSVIYVQPGQVVWLTVNVESFGDMWPAIVTNRFYYTAGMFLAPITTASYSLSPDSLLFSEDMVQEPSFTTYALATTKNRTTTYMHAANMDIDTWHWMYFNSEPNYDEWDWSVDAYQPNVSEDIYSVPLYVDPDVALGTTGTVMLGATSGKSNNNQLGGYVDGDPTADQILTQVSYDDLSCAKLNFVVGTKPAGVDYSDLNQAIADFEALTKADYTADSWADAETAYNDALDAKEATTQAAVDAATDALLAAMDALVDAPVLDYTRINAALDAADAADTTNATTSSKAAFDNALDAAVAAAANATTQAELDNAAEALEDAIDGLKAKADMTAIIDALAYADALDKSDWADETFDELDELVADAQAILAQADDFSDQDAVDAAAQAILDMRITVECADYNEVWDLMDEASFLNEDNYTTASWAALQTAIGAVEPSLGKSQQARVDAFAAAIQEALDGLKERIDTAGLAAVLSLADDANIEDYTTQDWMQLQVYVNAAKNDYIGKEANYAADDKQAEVDQLVLDIQDVLGRKLAAADYTAVEAAIAEIPEDLTVYTDDSVAALTEAYYAVNWNLKSNNQALVDQFAADIVAATNALELKKADLTALNAAIAATSTVLAEENYTAATWAAYADALEAAQTLAAAAPVLAEQDNVNAAAQALEAAQAALEYAPADYTEVNMWANKVADTDADTYTTATWAVYAAAKEAVDYTLTIDKQADVDEMATTLYNAYRGLVKAAAADYTAVNAAIADFNSKDTDLYTEDSVKAVEDAIADVTEGLNENHQAEVDAMAAAINTAIAGLTEKTYDAADYTAVDAAIADFAKVDEGLYTSASVQAVKDAIAAVVRGYDERQQGDVDAMAAAINAALDALELIPEPVGVVTEVTYTESPEITKDYAVAVNGRAAKIQFIDEKGNTVTLSRTDSRVAIAHYNAAGEEVEDLSRDLAYEVWTATLNLNSGDYTVISKDAVNGWEDPSLGCTVHVVRSTKNADVVSIEPAKDASDVGEAVDVKVVTGKDVLKIQILVDDATEGAKTFDLATYGTADGDTNVYNVFVKAYAAGEHTLKVRIKTADGWSIYDGTTAALTTSEAK